MFKSYRNCYDVSYDEVMELLLPICDKYQLTALRTVIFNSYSVFQIQAYLKKDSYSQTKVFIYLKQWIDKQDDIALCESYVVMMKLILGFKNPYFKSYAESFKNQILNYSHDLLKYTSYVILRHLFDHPKELKTYFQHLDKTNINQKYHLCVIFLLEQDFKKAYACLETLEYSGVLCTFDHQLYLASPMKYRRYILKQSIIKTGGLSLWTTKQLPS